MFLEVEHLDAAIAHALQALGHDVHADHPPALVIRDAARHVADRTEAEDGHAPALGHAGVLDGLHRGGHDV